MFASKLQNFRRLSISALTHLTSTRGLARSNTSANIYIDFESLRKYKAMYGHLLIPLSYSFDHKATDIGPCGSSLGKHAQFIRKVAKYESYRISSDNQKKLIELDFIWDLLDEKFRRLILAVVHYKNLYGNTFIPICFVVPRHDEAWPLSLRGERIGDKLRNVVAGEIPPAKLEFMKKLGIDAAALKLLDQRAATIIEALTIYKHIHNIQEDTVFTVPRDFVIPAAKPWPQHTWGFSLGVRVHGIRNRGYYHEYHDEFRSLGLKFDIRKYKKKNDSCIEEKQENLLV